jgi:hypothetical protein
MARDHARLLTRIGGDPDWRGLLIAEHDAYLTVLAEPTLNYCGVTQLAVTRWANQARDSTQRTVRRALETLNERRYLVIDWDDEEVMIRSLMRNDKVLRQPNVARSAYMSFHQIRSPKIRAHALFEMHRIHEGPASDWSQRSFEDGYAGGWLKEPLLQPFPEGFLEGFPEPWPKGFEMACGKG